MFLLKKFFKTRLKAFIILCVLFIIFLKLLALVTVSLETKPVNIIVWWTPFTLKGKKLNCNNHVCQLTNDRSYLNKNEAKGVLFYGSNVNLSDLPLPRRDLIWGLLHEESPRNTPVVLHAPILTIFNFSSTFSRYSDVPVTLQYLPSLEALTDKSYYIPVEEKSSLYSHLGRVVYLQSDCVTPNNRDSYVAELMKHITVDSYGECLNNKQLPPRLKNSMETMMSEELFKYLAPYKFAIAFENAICDDYITEKLWRSLMVGVIPIYIGSPTVKDWLPNNNSAILALDFKSPKDLASYLNLLDSDNRLYNEYMKHKMFGLIENKNLVGAMKNRYTGSDYVESAPFIEEFECFMCEASHQAFSSVIHISEKDYNCHKPISILSLSHNSSNWWHTEWELNKCQAVTARRMIDKGVTYSPSELTASSLSNYMNKNCDYKDPS